LKSRLGVKEIVDMTGGRKPKKMSRQHILC